MRPVSHSWTVLAVAMVACAAPSAHAGLIVNGSFETPVVEISDPVPGGSTRITGWTVVGSVDVARENFFQRAPLNPANHAFDGKQMIDLEGTPGPGSIAQTFATAPGQAYQLSFAFTRNLNRPDIYAHDPSLALATVTGNSTLLSYNFSSDLTGNNLLWTPVNLRFVADGTSATLKFASNDGPGSYLGGVVIDAVSVNAADVRATPEPGTMTLAVLGLASTGLGAWRRRCVVAG